MITTAFANKLLQYLFGQTKQWNETGGKCYLGLSMGAPDQDGSNFNEPDPESTGYSRKQICISIDNAMQWTNLMNVPTVGKIYNTEEIAFDEAKIDYPEQVTHFGVFHQEEGGLPLYTHPLTEPEINETSGKYEPLAVTVRAGEVLLFRKGALSLDFSQD